MKTKPPALMAGICALVALTATPADAHTDSDVVAVPAAAPATINLRPTHGCDGSPTTAVAIQAPVQGATAGAVAGWTASATPDGRGNTVLEWKGGSLPADRAGAFPVTFTTPDTVGELLVFPSVQYCENGEELSWIAGDPAAEFPAPRVLVLPAGSEPAGELADVAPDAPGRDQLTEIVDVDGGPSSTTSTLAATTTTAAPPAPADAASTTAADTTAADRSGAGAGAGDPTGGSADGGGSRMSTLALAAAAIAVVAAGALWLGRRRR